MDRGEEFNQLRLRFTDPIQHDYEVIRPVVLFSQPISDRSRETEMERTTVSEKARRFITEGMLGLVDQRKEHSGHQGHEYPKPVANYILYLKQLYPPIAYREIVRIVERKFGYKTNHHTVKHFLKSHPIPIQLELPLETFHEFEDAYEARWTVVRMYHEGWKKKSIADLLKLSRPHIDNLIEAFEKDGFAGLEDKRSRPANHPHNQLTLPFLEEVFKVQQEYPRAGRFRVRGILEQKLGEDTPSEGSVGRAMAYKRSTSKPAISRSSKPGRTSSNRSLRFNFVWPMPNLSKPPLWKKSRRNMLPLFKSSTPPITGHIESAKMEPGHRWLF